MTDPDAPVVRQLLPLRIREFVQSGENNKNRL